MPGENLQKLSKEELRELRRIVRREYFGDVPENRQWMIDEKEIDKLIDSLLPQTVEKCRELGIAKGFVESKKFFVPSRIVDSSGRAMMVEKGADDP